MACHTLPRRVTTLASCTALLLAACGDDGSRADTTQSTTTDPTSVSVSVSATDTTPPTSSASDSDSPTTSGSISATGGATTSGSTGPLTATDATSDATTSDTASTGVAPCPMGQIECDGNTAKVCDGMGGFSSETPCPSACDPVLGCVLCVPGSYQCVGDVSQVCTDDGMAWVDGQTCDAVQGLACDPGTGACLGACAGLGTSYIGCDYYPVVTQQYDPYVGGNPYAVAVANTTAQAATITITRGANAVLMDMVPASSVKVISLPWVAELANGSGPTVLAADAAYRLRSTQPVTVYQYNPLNADVTNDASLLLPVNTWTGNYLVASWPQWSGIPGFYAVTASQDNTKVTLSPSATGKAVQAGGGVAADGTGVVMLNTGDVIEVITQTNGNADLTGTVVTADKPVQVIGGHKCTNVPANVSACDHLEESMFPIETLAKEYVVVPPVQVPNDKLDKAQFVRIIASEANTTLVFNPDQPVAKNIANVGDFVQIPTSTAKFVVTADKKILVSQYMIGQSGGFGTSDPAMIQAVNPQQWRKSYLIHAPTSWTANYIDFIAKDGAAVTLDGNPVAGWVPIGATGYSVTHAKLNNGGDGNHTVAADMGVGIAVSGVQNAGSYWYPGGLDLDVIPQ